MITIEEAHDKKHVSNFYNKNENYIGDCKMTIGFGVRHGYQF